MEAAGAEREILRLGVHEHGVADLDVVRSAGGTQRSRLPSTVQRIRSSRLCVTVGHRPPAERQRHLYESPAPPSMIARVTSTMPDEV